MSRLPRPLRRRLLTPLLTALVVSTVGLGVAAPSAGALVDPATGTSYELDRVVVPMVFPVAGRVTWSDNWLACRSNCARMHMGQDLMGAKMTPLVAAFDGVVTTLKRETAVGQGNYVGITADRGPAAGWSVLYVHVNNDTPGTDDGKGTAQWAFPAGIAPGARVLAGQLIGWLGDSGNAESTGPHLHVELRKGTGWGGTVYNAHPSLLAARRLAAPTPSGPHPDGSLMRHPNGSLWLLEDQRKRPVSAGVLAAESRSVASAIPMTTAESLGYPTLPPAVLRDGTVARDPRGTTWLVSGGTRAKAPLPGLAALGLKNPVLVNVPDSDLAPLRVVPALPTTPFYPGAVVRVDGQNAVSQVGADGRLRGVPHHPALISHGWSSRHVAVLPKGTSLSRLAVASPGLTFRDGTVVQTPSHRVAVISGGKARRLHDGRQVAAYGYTGKPRQLVSDADLSALPTAELTVR